MLPETVSNEHTCAAADIQEAYVQAELDLERASRSIDNLVGLLRLQCDKRTARLAAKQAGHKVVVIDDLAEAATTLAGMLHALGHDVVVAHDGKAAIEAVRASHSDVAIVDLAMPVMDGFEVARQLRAQPTTASMTLIALTGFVEKHTSSCAREAGFNYFLTKPITTQQLEHVLDEL